MARPFFAESMQILVAMLTVATPGLAQDSTARIDQIVQSYVDAKQFMGSVLVARADKVIFSKGYGSANLEWNITNSPTTKFRLGSVTKQFTAACVLLLEERGKLKVEDLIKKHFPDAPAAWDRITIFHLLTHTAGIPNLTGFPDNASLQTLPATVEQLVQRFRDKPLEFEPGERMQYSNSGYILLGALVEKISGTTYEKFLRESIFTPLGMKDSGNDSNSAIIPLRAAGYVPSQNDPVNAAFIHMSTPHAAGALYSTTEDLLRWEQGLFGHKLLSAASLRKMTTPFKNDYAFGLVVNASNGRKVIQHGGEIDGFNTVLSYYPDDQVAVVVLANLNGPAPEEIAWKLGALAHGEAVRLISERKEITVPSAILKKYVGTYSLAPNVNLTITLDGEQLISQISGQTRVPLFAESETKFFPKVIDAELEFLKDANHAVTHLVLRQGGRDRNWPRTSDTVLKRREISLPAEKLAEFVGTYELRPGFDFVITLEDDQLVVQPTGQPKDPVFAESDHKFFSKQIDAQIEFLRDQSGAVTHLIAHQGAIHTKAPKK